MSLNNNCPNIGSAKICEYSASQEDIDYNKGLVKYILDSSDYDFGYLTEWCLPSFWEERLWGCTFCVCELLLHFMAHSNLNLTEEMINKLEEEYIDSLS